jgi:hypothetical protein
MHRVITPDLETLMMMMCVRDDDRRGGRAFGFRCNYIIALVATVVEFPIPTNTQSRSWPASLAKIDLHPTSHHHHN